MLPLFSVNSVMASTSDSVPSFTAVGYTRTDATSPPNNHHLSSLSHVTLITVTVLAVAVTVSLALYFLLRYRNSNRFRFLRRVWSCVSWLPDCRPSRQSSILPILRSSMNYVFIHVSFTFEFGAVFHHCLTADPQGNPQFSPFSGAPWIAFTFMCPPLSSLELCFVIA